MKLIEDFRLYLQNSRLDDPYFWVFPAGTVLLVLLLAYLITNQASKKVFFTRTTYIYLAFVWAGAVAGAIAAGVGLYYWIAGLYADQPLQVSHLLSMVLGLAAVIWSVMLFANQQTHERVRNLIAQPCTHHERTHNVFVLRNTFERLKIVAWLLPLAAALALLPVFRSDHNKLLCVVIDNSFSMGSSNPSGMVPLQVGKDALARTVRSLDVKTDFVLGYFDNRAARQSAPGLAGSQSPSGLSGTVLIYDQDKSAASGQIQNIPVGENGSPICETVWKTYLVAKDAHQTRNYDRRFIVIITDGLENGITGSLDGLFCDQPEFEAFFPANQVKIVKLEEITYPNFPNESSEIFMTKIRQCGYAELDGASLTSYNESIDEVMAEVKNDFSFPIWVLIIYLIYALILLFQTPKQNL